MKISQRTVNDLLAMIYHSRQNIGYGESGSFTVENKKGEWVFDTKSVKQVERAIDFIKKVLLERQLNV